MKKGGVIEDGMVSAYDNEIRQITFYQRPLGFSVIMDGNQKNAFVSNMQNKHLANEELELKIPSKFYMINGKRVDDLKHKDNLKLITEQTIPSFIDFKEVLIVYGLRHCIFSFLFVLNIYSTRKLQIG